ncbi:hypothetical protein PTKIN_Ptkin08bG0137900 [Pterospermum kingtungense]
MWPCGGNSYSGMFCLVWHLLAFAWDDKHNRNLSYSDWLCHKIKTLPQFEFQQLAYTLWYLWGVRNRVIHGEQVQPTRSIAGRINFLIDEYNKAIHKEKISHCYEVVKWKKPPVGMIKINVDGAFRIESNAGSIGVEIRDSDGFVLAAKVCKVDNAQTSFYVEALAALHGLEFAADLGYKRAILESDSFTVIKTLRSNMEDLSLY